MSTIERLKTLLASVYSLASQSHMAHWNVTGPRFVSLHKLFKDFYEELYGQSDAIAEYIRSKDTEVPAPGGLSVLARMSEVKELPASLLEEKRFLDGLIAGNDVLIRLTKELGDQAGSEGDTDTQNFMNELSVSAKNRRWMLVASK